MDHNFKELDVIRAGASNGDRTILRIVPHHAPVIHAISVPRAGFSYTGPTWAYVFENEGLTLIDSGEFGSFHELDEGLSQAGFRAADIQRVIITHGHEDHDGSVAELVDATGAEVWAHEIYYHLQEYDPRTIFRWAASPLQEEFGRLSDSYDAFPQQSEQRDNYIHARQSLTIDHPIRPGEQLGQMILLHAPGHSPDELCMKLGDVVFTGDHVLPEISPHPTMKAVFPPAVRGRLPQEYQDESDWYGLATYLKSLKIVSDMGGGTQVLPAHRYFNRDKFNFINALRARDIIEHHGERLESVLEAIGSQPVGLEDLTRRIFSHRTLEGTNLRAAMAETVAHVELLEDAGDLEVSDNPDIRGTGSENYRQFIHELVG